MINDRDKVMFSPNGRMVPSIQAVNGTLFTAEESVRMAQLVFKRFGYDKSAAAAAWRRLLQNGCSESDFEALVYAVPA